MKKVFITVRDKNNKVIAKREFYTFSSFEFDAADFILNNLKTNCEVEIKVGAQFRAYQTENELLEAAAEYKTDLYDAIDSFLNTAINYVENYLPRY